MIKYVVSIVLIPALLFLSGCASSITHKVGYPAPDELFITVGDDPGSESNTPYSPKGQLIHVEKEAYVPLPILGIFMKNGNAEPQYVFNTEIIPQVQGMGGDALIGATISYTPAGPWILGLFGMRTGATTVVMGQVVKRGGKDQIAAQTNSLYQTSSDVDNVWTTELSESEQVQNQFYDILKIKQGYFLVKSDHPDYFVKGKICDIVRGSPSDYTHVGEGQVVQTQDNNIAFKILNGSIKVGDKITTE